jgi:hypothetical protein
MYLATLNWGKAFLVWYVYTYIYTNKYIYAYIYEYTNIHNKYIIRLEVCIYISICTWLHWIEGKPSWSDYRLIHVCSYIYVCTYIYEHINLYNSWAILYLYIHMYIYIYIQTYIYAPGHIKLRESLLGLILHDLTEFNQVFLTD